MNKSIPYLIQGKNILLVINGQSHTISKDTHMSFVQIVEAIKAQDWDTVAELVDTRNALVNFSQGNVTIDNDEVFWKGQPWTGPRGPTRGSRRHRRSEAGGHRTGEVSGEGARPGAPGE